MLHYSSKKKKKGKHERAIKESWFSSCILSPEYIAMKHIDNNSIYKGFPTQRSPSFEWKNLMVNPYCTALIKSIL